MFLTFQAPNLMSLFRCLDRTKESFQVRGLLSECFLTGYVFTVSCKHFAQTPSCRTTPCRLCATAYSIYSQLPSILRAVPPSATWGPALPWWQVPNFHFSPTANNAYQEVRTANHLLVHKLEGNCHWRPRRIGENKMRMCLTVRVCVDWVKVAHRMV